MAGWHDSWLYLGETGPQRPGEFPSREGHKLGSTPDQCLERTLELVERMLRLADDGDAVREDQGCGVLYGVLRDSAYKLKHLAEAERRAHHQKNLPKS